MVVVTEIVCVGCEVYEPIEKAVDALRQVQADFEFRVPRRAERHLLSRYDLQEYKTSPTLQELASHRSAYLPGQPVTIIGVVDSPIEGNIFGAFAMSKTPGEGSALLTVHGFERYSSSLHAYLCFFFVKFALQSLDWRLTTHPEARRCIFDPRNNKRDLIPILEHPVLCDETIEVLQPSLRTLASGIHSIDRLFDVISKAVAAARVSVLVMKGGGVKGLALAGALSVLGKPDYKRFFDPSTFVGTSAGAIVAALAAVGLTPAELRQQLGRDFREFLDPWYRRPLNFVLKGGLNSGDPIVQWLHEVLCARIPRSRAADDTVMFEEVAARGRRLVMYAANRFGTVTFDSKTAAALFVTTAARLSMSIPFVFITLSHEGEETFDGGLLNNYPVEVFLRENPTFDGEFLALYLSDGAAKPSRLKLRRLLSILLQRDDVLDVRRHPESTVVIECEPIGTTDFSLTKHEKALLWHRGRLAALNKVIERGWDTSEAVVGTRERLRRRVERIAGGVSGARRWSKLRRRALWLVLLVIGSLFLSRQLCLWPGSVSENMTFAVAPVVASAKDRWIESHRWLEAQKDILIDEATQAKADFRMVRVETTRPLRCSKPFEVWQRVPPTHELRSVAFLERSDGYFRPLAVRYEGPEALRVLVPGCSDGDSLLLLDLIMSTPGPVGMSVSGDLEAVLTTEVKTP